MPVELTLRFPDADHVEVRFDGAESGTVPFASPLTERDHRDLRWFVESYGTRYFDRRDGVEARRVRALLPVWGNRLFDAVFAETAARRVFDRFRDACGDDRLLTVAADLPAILALPWELLHETGEDEAFLFLPPRNTSLRGRVDRVTVGRSPLPAGERKGAAEQAGGPGLSQTDLEAILRGMRDPATRRRLRSTVPPRKEELDSPSPGPTLAVPESDDRGYSVRESDDRGTSVRRSPSRSAGAQVPRYTVWFGTNRQPVDPDDVARGFTGARGDRVRYGACEVTIPESHRFGSVGSSWLRRWRSGSDDRLRLAAVAELAETAFWSGLRRELGALPADERSALVFLHGFNVSFGEAAIRAAQIGFDLKVQGATGFFSWPSKGDVRNYPDDEAAIEGSEEAIAGFLVGFATRAGAERVHVVAHSMGNRGLLRAMQRIQAEAASRSPVRFGQVILAAPDLDVELFRSLAHLYPQLAERTTLYASPADRAVGLSRWLHGAPRVGLTPPVTVAQGIDTIEVPDFDLDCLGHGYFAQAEGVLHDMFDLLRRNAAPQERQRLTAQPAAGGPAYWRLRV